MKPKFIPTHEIMSLISTKETLMMDQYGRIYSNKRDKVECPICHYLLSYDPKQGLYCTDNHLHDVKKELLTAQ